MDFENLEQLEMLTGPGLATLLRNRESTEEHLDDPSPKLRWAAVVLMTHHWNVTDEFKEKCEAMARHDPEENVRNRAICSLGALFAGSKDRRIGKFLASIIYDNSRTHSCRVSAYRALLLVSGVVGGEIYRPSLAGIRIPEDIDWTVVEGYQNGKK